MRIVTPVSVFDQHLAGKWCEVIKHLDCGRNHELHVVYPRSAELAASSIREALQDYFDSVKLHQMEVEPMGGWPFGPNTQFHACATFMAKDNPRQPWFLCELDCYPVKSNSFDLLASRYASAGTPFFGKISPTFWRDDNGLIASSLFGKDDMTMSGCAIYPGDILTRRFTSSLMADLMKGFDETTGAPNTGWDVHLRYAIRKEGVSDAGNLIADNWNTIKYKNENGRFVCENNPEHEIYKQHPNFEIRKTNNPVGPEALFIHGCKDESLADLILGGSKPTEYVPPKVMAAQVVTEKNNSILEDQILEMKRMMEQQQQLITSLLQQQASAPVRTREPKILPPEPIKKRNCTLNRAKDALRERLESLPEQDGPSGTDGPIGTDGICDANEPESNEPTGESVTPKSSTPPAWGDIIAEMRKAGRSVRASELADKFNMESAFMREYCAKIPGLKVGVPPVYWVTLVE